MEVREPRTLGWSSDWRALACGEARSRLWARMEAMLVEVSALIATAWAEAASRPGGVEPAVEPQHAQAGAKTLLGMGAAGASTARMSPPCGPGSREPSAGSALRPLGIAPVRARHVIRIGAVPASAEAALMGGDALAAMECTRRCGWSAHVNLRADERVRHRVEEALGLDMIIEADPSQAPLGIFVILGRQGSERCPFDALEELAPAHAEAAHRMGVEALHRGRDRGVALGEREERPVPQPTQDVGLGEADPASTSALSRGFLVLPAGCRPRSGPPSCRSCG